MLQSIAICWPLLTAQPWAERGSWFTHGLFFYFVFLVLSVTRPKLLLGQILNDATCDVYLPKAVETLRTMLQILFSLLWVK